jgi:hypothetical protein
MSIALIVLLVLALTALSAIVGLALVARFLTSETDEDKAVRFDPFGARPFSPWFIEFFQRWRGRSRRLTYRRDRRGRFRRHRR